MNEDFLLSSYTYQLPQKLIAQAPVTPRDSSRLLIVDSPISCRHEVFQALPHWLRSGDLLVLNDTRVIPARLYGRKTTGSQVEILLLEEKPNNCWLALVKPGKRFTPGSKIIFDALDDQKDLGDFQLQGVVIDRDAATGGRLLQFELPEGTTLWHFLANYGQLPLPPYITENDSPGERYQTVYAEKPGAIAAPTAGLHFTPELLAKLEQQGIDRTYITLHVGVGTFRPVETEKILSHQMHQEWIEVSPETVAKINQTKARGGRVFAVGTTAVRALEGAAQQAGSDLIQPFRGKTNLFIYPGYQWQIVDGLITNFHLPASSLLMLVSALIGRKRLLSLYQEAIALNYRFYSFGDAMLILPQE
ncbi:tRNA preQ1(34) S-adenosylmethionine ribosyltransferase-isomerase QueA [Waterburya agarophytonicola K14]|uniref:S-adenosylmethionine:tRNA ribosyltransferase-isomerase n=1 Tax=Waterburya agarophytonicola KI4 TaxID=2874699 RepID=A0A964FEX0_9CYAN|nr:tRNA preQ1(34) S-adenosylmethionine ribosyltransferase-isomerase QueA [Waterburya agarophytonicola]MCC0176367.1 tRNA preQ1(34) S-adenosylmethionine ribosyltransferase-isomerase QueA [Waterburya agarophytonicola KI4]